MQFLLIEIRRNGKPAWRDWVQLDPGTSLNLLRDEVRSRIQAAHPEADFTILTASLTSWEASEITKTGDETNAPAPF